MAINPLQAPINYMALMPDVNIGKQFAELGQVLAQRRERQQAETLRQEYATDLRNAISNPTQSTWAQMIAKYPKQREAFGDAAKIYGQERLNNEFGLGAEISTALENNRPDVALDRLKPALEGYKRSGISAGTFQQVADLIEAGNVTGAQAATNFALATLDPERFKKMVDANQASRESPYKLKEAQAKANEAVTNAQLKVQELRARLEAEPDVARQRQLKIEIDEAEVQLKKAQTAASAGVEARAAELQPSVLAQNVAAATAAEADAQRKVAEATDTPSRLEAEAALRKAQIAKENALAAASVGGEARAAAQAPEVLRRLVADADKAIADAKTAQATASTAEEIAKANANLAKAQAQKAAVDAKYAERVQIAGLDKTNWDIKNLRDQIRDRSARLNLDAQKTAADVADKMSSIKSRLTEIPAESRKLINESAALASTSKQSAVQFNDLAKRIEAAQGGKGAFTSATEWLAKATGRQDEWTQIRNEYTRVRNTIAIKSLPPGVATDKDIELALKGIPPETANAATLASFLRGMAKLQDIDSAINNAKTDWLSQNNGLLTRAKGTFIAGDYAVNTGETFNDFAQRIVGDVAQKYRSPEQIAEERRQQSIGQIPTNRAPVTPPAPAATAASVMSQADAILRGGR